jgi:hypothetical protein
MVSLAATLSVAPLATTTAPLLLSALPPVRRRVPAPIVVVPA